MLTQTDFLFLPYTIIKSPACQHGARDLGRAAPCGHSCGRPRVQRVRRRFVRRADAAPGLGAVGHRARPVVVACRASRGAVRRGSENPKEEKVNMGDKCAE